MHRRRFPRARIWAWPAAAALLFTGLAGTEAVATTGAGGSAPARVLSVAPDGHGSACTTNSPCSLPTAQSEVRAATGRMSGDIDVVLADGTYRLDSTLEFDALKGDGGTHGHTVNYAAAPGAHPVLSGGERVGGWKQGADGVWQARVPAGTKTRQLYVDGVRGNIASEAAPGGLTQTATGYTTTDSTIEDYGNVTDVEFVYDIGWVQVRCRVASAAGTTITMDEPCFQNSVNRQYPISTGDLAQIQNAKELLDDPGEWYLDEHAHTVYYRPREGQDMRTADVEIPRLQTLVSGTGTLAHPLTGLTLRGLTFAYGGWTAPDGDDGFAETQANMRFTGENAWKYQGTCDKFSTTDPGTCPYGDWTMTPGNVVFDHATGLTVTGDTFTHLGAAGLQLGQAVTEADITGNVFTDISSSGMEIGNGADADPADLAVIPSHNTIADNWVHNIAVEYTGGIGIFQGYTRYDTITHNQIDDVPYSGISSNWGWGRVPVVKAAGNRITDNLVEDAMQQRGDGGGIYVLGQEGDSLADGLLISGNVVRYDANYGNGIYTDGGSQYVTETGNAVYGNDTASFGGCREPSAPYGDFSFTGNYYETLTPGFTCGDPDNATITGNTQIGSDGTGVPASLLANAGLEPAYAHLAAAPAGRAPVNLALHKPAQAQYLDGSTAALQPGSQASYATDGKPDTSTQATDQYLWQLVVDLQNTKSLGSATVTMPQSNFATAFHVDASTNGTDWTTVGKETDTGWGTIPVTFAAPVTARYLRIVADRPDQGGQRGSQMAIAEVGAYAPGPGNLALDAPTQALYIDGTKALLQPGSQPTYADDGDPATSTQATAQFRWMQKLDLGRARSVDVIALLQPDSAFATHWHVDVSLDGSTFWTVARHSDTAGGLSGVRLDSPVRARYVRIIADRPDNGAQLGGQMALSEVQVIGQQ
ncbi:discoidin domain-containing protein [Actinacidiphila guanduensis]|uniref:Right handed beta helix region n=1 Tax=Actinacidiphila guanduensis TaxID=310781 RepID=A0A1H0PVR9_9ACTN|nr:discoidin domain-containing protein [Actinacidiphila guanduensis]SDP08890.1 Right handed beta helix region [Actinacidiphila guanduensis]